MTDVAAVLDWDELRFPTPDIVPALKRYVAEWFAARPIPNLTWIDEATFQRKRDAWLPDSNYEALQLSSPRFRTDVFSGPAATYSGENVKKTVDRALQDLHHYLAAGARWECEPVQLYMKVEAYVLETFAWTNGIRYLPPPSTEPSDD